MLAATDTTAAIDAVLLDLSRQLVRCIDYIWEKQKQAKYLKAAACLPTVTVLLRYFQRKFKPFTITGQSRHTKCFTGTVQGGSPGSVYYVDGSATTDYWSPE